MNELENAVHYCRGIIVEKHLCKGTNERYRAALNHLLKLVLKDD